MGENGTRPNTVWGFLFFTWERLMNFHVASSYQHAARPPQHPVFLVFC